MKINYLSRQVTIHTLNNNAIPFKQCIKVTFKLENLFTTGTFYVTTQDFNKNYNMILGFDYLKNNHMLLDCENQILHFKRVKIPLYMPIVDSNNTNKEINVVQNHHINDDTNENFNPREKVVTDHLENQVAITKRNKNDEYYGQSAIHMKAMLGDRMYGLFKNQDSNLEGDNKISNSQQDLQGKGNCITNKSHVKNTINLKIRNKTKLQPGESKIVALKCSHNLQSDKLIWVEPIVHKLSINYDSSIHQVPESRIIHIPVKNTSNLPLTVNKNMKIGEIITDFDLYQNLNDIKKDGIVYEVNNMQIEEVKKLREQELKPEDFKLDHMDSNMREKTLKLLLEHAHAFSKSYKTLGQTSLVQPKFDLIHDYPIQTKPYKIPQNARTFVNQEIQKLLDANIVEQTESNYAFPVVVVKKKSTSKPDNTQESPVFRITIDYRMLNDILQSTPYPIPDIKTILQNISGKNFYSVVDFRSAFQQLTLRPEDKPKLAFITEDAHLQPTRMGFGSKISTQTFAKLIDKILGKFDKRNIAYFVDDVVIAHDSREGMLDLLKQVLSVLIEHNLTIDPAKMQICKEEIEFLGYKINKQGYSPSDKNINKIQSLARPKNKKGVKSLLGLANYFRSLIHKYTDIVNPLVELTKNKQRFKWSQEAEEAFLQIQEAILRNPTLKPPDFNKEFFLITDCSRIATSGILAQQRNNFLVPIEFCGRKLRDAEKCYDSTKAELLAIHEAIMHFKYILTGRKFTLLTDSQALTNHLDLSKQPDIVKRWSMDLNDFDFEIEHIEGEINPADYISRNINTLQDRQNLQNNLFETEKAMAIQNIIREQAKDKKLCVIIDELSKKKIKKKFQKYEFSDGKLLTLKQGNNSPSKNLIIVPDSLKQTILITAHKVHFGFSKTYETIKSIFYWNGMYKDTKIFCANCVQCNTYKPHRTVDIPIKMMDKDSQPGHVLHIDVVGKLPLTLGKNCFMLTIVDAFSRYLEIFPIKNVEAHTILNKLNDYFAAYGLPKEVHFDNGKYFRSAVLKNYFENLSIDIHFASVYYPQSQGLIEVSHRLLKTSLAAMSKDTFEWDIRVNFFKLMYNTSKHRVTGYSPSMLFFGREILTPFSSHIKLDKINMKNYVYNRLNHLVEVRKQVLQNHHRVQKEYDKKNLGKKLKTFDIGQTVYLKNFRYAGALQPKFRGPYQIIRVFRNNNYLIKLKNAEHAKPIKIHVSKLYAPQHLK